MNSNEEANTAEIDKTLIFDLQSDYTCKTKLLPQSMSINNLSTISSITKSTEQRDMRTTDEILQGFRLNSNFTWNEEKRTNRNGITEEFAKESESSTNFEARELRRKRQFQAQPSKIPSRAPAILKYSKYMNIRSKIPKLD